MGKKPTRAVNRGKRDYSDLLLELKEEQDVRKNPTYDRAPYNSGNRYKKVIEYNPGGSISNSNNVSQYRQRIMSSQNIKYVYDGRKNLLHDKSCRYARQIPDNVLCHSDYYLPEMNQCRECAARAYIHAGAKDYNNYGVYQKLFERMHVDENMMRHIYVDCGMKTEAYYNVLTVWNNEDTWKIEVIDKNGMVRLLHNNYHVDRTGKRYFDQGFHVQSEYLSNTRAEQAIEAIATYSFDMHSQFAAEQKERITYYQKQTHQTSSSEPSDKRDKKEHISLFKRIKEKFISKADKKPSDKDNLISLKIDEFNLVSEKGYPRDGDRCIYIWRTRENDIRWQVGIYDRTQHAFFITFGESTFITDKNKVIAWKRINSGEGISGLNQGNAD